MAFAPCGWWRGAREPRLARVSCRALALPLEVSPSPPQRDLPEATLRLHRSFLPHASLDALGRGEERDVAPGERIRGDGAGSRSGLAQPPTAEQIGSRLALKPGPDAAAAAAAGWVPDSLFPTDVIAAVALLGVTWRWQEQRPWAEPRHVPAVGQTHPAPPQSP